MTKWPYEAIYFGTWQIAGHYHFLPGMKRPGVHDVHLTPWDWDIDSAPLWGVDPAQREDKSWRRRGEYGKQGDATLRHKDGWTLLAVADYTVDSRRNSHASFAFLGDLTFDEAVERARETFPEVVERVGEIREVPDGC